MREHARGYTGPKDPQGAAQSAIGTIVDIAVNFVRPKSFLTPTSGLVRDAG